MRPQLRFTVQSLMVVVAFVALLMALAAYRERLRGRALYHEAQFAAHSNQILASGRLPPGTLVVKNPGRGITTAYQMTPQAEWHARMASQYSGAAVRIGVLITAVLLISGLGIIARSFLRRTNS